MLSLSLRATIRTIEPRSGIFRGFSSSAILCRRGQGRSAKELEVFRSAIDKTAGSAASDLDPHLNPVSHQDLLESLPSQRSNSKCLRICVLGVPNSGKSSLVNQLVGANVCAHSRKTHTTRENTNAIITRDETQLVFCDTPGIVTDKDIKKFKLEDSIVLHPGYSAKHADLIIVLQDVSNRFTREAIDKRILKLLCRHSASLSGIPSILVLNKLDICPKGRSVYDLIHKLTCGYLNGTKANFKVKKGGKEVILGTTSDSYLKRKIKEAEWLSKNQNEDEDDREVIKIRSYDDFKRVLENNEITDELVTQLTNGLVGWPGFKEVFTVSALEGKGVDDLRDYLVESAVEGPWEFHQDLKTDLDPRLLVLRVIKSKLLEVLPKEAPYLLHPQIASWNVEDGILRLNIQIESPKPRLTALMLSGKNTTTLREIARLAEHDLQNFFGTEVFILLSVIATHKPEFRKNKKAKELDMIRDQIYDKFLLTIYHHVENCRSRRKLNPRRGWSWLRSCQV